MWITLSPAESLSVSFVERFLSEIEPLIMQPRNLIGLGWMEGIGDETSGWTVSWLPNRIFLLQVTKKISDMQNFETFMLKLENNFQESLNFVISSRNNKDLTRSLLNLLQKRSFHTLETIGMNYWLVSVCTMMTNNIIKHCKFK